MTGKLHLIALGGAGTNIVASVSKNLEQLGDGFADVAVRFIDTTYKTIQAYPEYKDKFYKVDATSALNNEMDGTGGERKNSTTASDMNISVRNFVDKGLKNGKNDYYVLVASGSGGSGSVLEPLLLKAMLEKDLTVSVVTVGDSSNLLSLNNSINALASLQGVAKASKKAVSVMYYNNTFNGVTSPATESKVNTKIFKMLSVMSLFVSGKIQNIDHQDMGNFFRPDRYTSFKIPAGIYSLGVSLTELSDPNVILVRTIIDQQTEDINMSIVPFSNKTGTITREYPQFDTYPLFLTLRKDVLNTEVNYLQKEYEKIENMKKSKYVEFEALDSADIDNDLGLAL